MKTVWNQGGPKRTPNPEVSSTEHLIVRLFPVRSLQREPRLGHGSFGVVNRARDIRNKCVSMATYVAVKTIPKKKISDPKSVKDEFNVIRQLDHAHICKAYECYEDRRNIYLVMDICSGGTLLETLCVQQRFPEQQAAKIMRQTLSALLYLHQANFIFRDLKTVTWMNDEKCIFTQVCFVLSSVFCKKKSRAFLHRERPWLFHTAFALVFSPCRGKYHVCQAGEGR